MGCYGVELTGGIAAGQTLDALADTVTLKPLLPKKIPQMTGFRSLSFFTLI